MVKLSPEQERVSNLISDTVSLLCKNGLKFKSEMKVTGLLGISLDNDVFLVQIEKCFGETMKVKLGDVPEVKATPSPSESGSQGPERKKEPRKRHRSKSPTMIEPVKIKCEREEETDIVIMDSDSESVSNMETGTAKGAFKTETDQNFDSFMSQQVGGQPVGMVSSGSGQHGQHGQRSEEGRYTPWDDDPLAALAAASQDPQQDNSQSSAGDDSLDPQALSTLAGVRQAGSFPAGRGHSPYSSPGYRTPVRLPVPHGQPWSPVPGIPSAAYMDRLAPYMARYKGVLNTSARKTVATPGDKQYVCGYPGCDKSYFSRPNLLHHQTYKHGRQRGQPGPCVVREVPAANNSHEPPSMSREDILSDVETQCNKQQKTNNGELESSHYSIGQHMDDFPNLFSQSDGDGDA